MEIMNTFNVQVGLMKAYYERFVYYLTQFIHKCLHSMCSYYKRLVRNCKHIPGNVTLLNKEDELHEITHANLLRRGRLVTDDSVKFNLLRT